MSVFARQIANREPAHIAFIAAINAESNLVGAHIESTYAAPPADRPRGIGHRAVEFDRAGGQA